MKTVLSLPRGACIFLKLLIEFVAAGFLYILVEMVFRAIRNHPPVQFLTFFLGAGAYLIVVLLHRLPLRGWWRLTFPLIGGLGITLYELLFGLYFNVYRGMNLWSYRGCGYELFYSQICLKFSLTWVGAAAVILVIDHFVEEKLLAGTRFAFRRRDTEGDGA